MTGEQTLTTPEETEQKIQQLKNSVKKTTALCDALNGLIPEAELNELLKIEFVAEILGTRTFGVFKKVEENAFNRLKVMYP